jgi:hypothetical protein
MSEFQTVIPPLVIAFLHLAILNRLRRDGEKVKEPIDELENAWQEKN